MSPQRGLPVSAEIQLNKLIRDFLSPVLEPDNVSSAFSEAPQVEGAPCQRDGRSQNVVISEAILMNASVPTENPSLLRGSVNMKETSSVAVDCIDAVGLPVKPRNAVENFNGASSVVQGSTFPDKTSTPDDVRLDIPEQKGDLRESSVQKSVSRLKIFRLSKCHSLASSLYRLAVETQGDGKENQHKSKAVGTLKLTRISSLPCHDKLHIGSEKGWKPSSKKPPKPPKSPLEKGSESLISKNASAGTILVLRASAKRARLDRKKRPVGQASSNASLWALAFTLFFAVAMLGEGFWSVKFPLLTADSSTNATIDVM
ncbi:hypothetical protein KP509_28G041700 [Ceratopteris richardii]|nr:hypothetical protein KP509_28G041700 [Ceratopteris richardii]